MATKPIPKRQYTLRYYEVYSWPELDHDTPLELPGKNPSLDMAVLSGDPTPQTTLTRDVLFRHSQIERIKVEHERRVRRMARFGLHKVNEFNLRYEFAAFRYRNTSKLYIDAGRTLAEGALRRIRDHTKPQMQFARRTVDVAGFLQDYCGRVDAAYFSNLRIMNVRSATISGDNVRESGEFEHYAGKGDLPAVSIHFDVIGVPRRVMVTTDGLFMFWLDNDSAALTVADYVNDALEKYATFEDVSLGDGQVSDDECIEGGDLISNDL